MRLKIRTSFCPPKTTVVSMDGPFFFGAAERLESALESIHGHADILVMRLGRVPFIDATGLKALRDLWTHATDTRPDWYYARQGPTCWRN